MNHKRLLQRMIGLTLVVLLLVACGAPTPTSTPTSTPAPVPTPTPTPVPVSVSGHAKSFDDPPQPASDRNIVLCLIEKISEVEGEMYMSASCVLDADLTTVTDSQGHFELSDVPDGSYMLFYDNTVDDFEAGLAKWNGEVIRVGYFDREVKELPSYQDVFIMVFNELGTKFSEGDMLADMLAAKYATPPDCPFLVVYTLNTEALALAPVIVEVEAGETAEVDIKVFGSEQQ